MGFHPMGKINLLKNPSPILEKILLAENDFWIKIFSFPKGVPRQNFFFAIRSILCKIRFTLAIFVVIFFLSGLR